MSVGDDDDDENDVWSDSETGGGVIVRVDDVDDWDDDWDDDWAYVEGCANETETI